MRLRKIRLAGFKSFVDPTTIPFPGDLVSVVGPNGCGKSNIIDAVRWVMGEVSARQLRGETMADVVFNGSGSRKPVGQASVELIFDNSDGRLGGRFAAYAEISVRRQVGRDGQSAYFLNGARYRRRDVMDVFLGTGLGPRSYSIIEQGMISRVVEARPEDLREFLEEAAGISRYKERRRDTEHRIRHTQENLERLGDLREELARRLAHLERQARAAERYKVLKERERVLGARLQALRWSTLAAECERHQARLRDQHTRLQAALAAQRDCEARLERSRAAHGGASETFNQRYRDVLEAGAAVARTEESIQALERRRVELEDRRRRESGELEALRAELAAQGEAIAALEAEVERERPQLEHAEGRATQLRAELDGCETAMHDWQQRFESLSEGAAEPARVLHAEQARAEQLRVSLARAEERQEALRAERATLAGERAADEVERLDRRAGDDQERLRELGAEVREAGARLAELRERAAEAAESLAAEGEELHAVRSGLAALRALQQQALRPQSGEAARWLERHGLAEAPRLGERVSAAPGWERAVEAVLAERLDDVLVDSLDGHEQGVAALDGGALTLTEAVPAGPAQDGDGTLRSKVEEVPAAVAPLLAAVGVAESLDRALARRATLGAGQVLVTPEGERVARGWIALERGGEPDDGPLRREQAIRAAAERAGELERRVAGARAALERAGEAVRDAEEQVAEVREQHQELGSRAARSGAELAAARARGEAAERRQRTLAGEAERIELRLAEERAELAAAERRATESEAELTRHGSEREALQRRREELQRRLEQARTAWQGARQDAYERGLRVEARSTRIEALREGVERERRRIADLEARLGEAGEVLSAGNRPIEEARERLGREREAHAASEQALDAARAAVEALDGEVRELERERRACEERVGAEREQVEGLRVAGEELRVRRETVEEQLAEGGFEAREVLGSIEEEVSAEALEGELESVARRIARLGPINLAAIEEREQLAERKSYLDRQHQDLEDALATLESAIGKIDRETRARFKDTYERVNRGLAQSFPRLFGGGHAELQLTGEDLLSTGVTVMARPPGKRNSGIQQLSGGEKALTAVALVFAIFELNPAPFCLLDEVDAPLDDANVLRFCDLVKEMAERVQFLIVTHNKVTMEISQQLIGVTMHEPGVSRLVAVDIEQAVAMAAT